MQRHSCSMFWASGGTWSVGGNCASSVVSFLSKSLISTVRITNIVRKKPNGILKPFLLWIILPISALLMGAGFGYIPVAKLFKCEALPFL